MDVVTYTEAYRDQSWQVCTRHAADTPKARSAREKAGVGPLGRVEIGQHHGECDVCLELAIREARP